LEDWRPQASWDNITLRAQILAKIRAFFSERDVTEVQTPIFVQSAPSNPGIQPFSIKNQFLHTSPEFAMKRILAAYHQSIYQICPVFRAGESGQYHRPEFTMLEWYRMEFDLEQLMTEIENLIGLFFTCKWQRLSYKDLFIKCLECDPFSASVEELKNLVKRNNISIQGADVFDKDDWLDLLFSHCLQPFLKEHYPFCIVYHYPASQSELAKIKPETEHVAERFEVFVEGIELANGYDELQAPEVYCQRVSNDNQKRKRLGLNEIEPCSQLLAAMESGMPQCSGVSLGVDRLVMLIAGEDNILGVGLFFTFKASLF